jgi:transposase
MAVEPMSESLLAVRLVFADSGSFHDVVVHVPADVLRQYDRLIDAIREDPGITSSIFVDRRRLVAACVLAESGSAED